MNIVLPHFPEVVRATLTLTATNVYEAQAIWKSRESILTALTATGAEFECAELTIVIGQRIYATTTGGRHDTRRA
jgi:hypothetical protein